MLQQHEVRNISVSNAYVDGDSAGPVAIQLRYASADPFALSVTVLGVDWCCARDLLLGALAGIPSGVGDVRIHCDADYAYFDMASPVGRVVASIGRSDAESFAAATLDLVPRGEESDQIDLDVEIAGILTSAGS